MNCDGVRGLLSAYVDGELSAGELLRVEQHLRRCHACADEVDSLRQTIALVASLDEVEVPASFHAQLHERLVALGPPVAGAKRTKATLPPLRKIRKWAMPAAAAAAVIAIGLTSLQQMKDLPPGGIVTSLFPPELNPKPREVVVVPTPGKDGGQLIDSNGKNDPHPTDSPSELELPGGDDTTLVLNQPQSNNGPGVAESGGHVVTNTENQPGQTAIMPLTSYQVKLTAIADTAAARQSLFAIGSAQEMHDGTIRITVPATEREETLAAIQTISGLTMTGDPQIDSHDYAAQLALARQTLEVWQGAVSRLERQIENLQDATDREAAELSLADARQQAAHAEDGIRHLESEAGKAIFEIRLQAAVQ